MTAALWTIIGSFAFGGMLIIAMYLFVTRDKAPVSTETRDNLLEELEQLAAHLETHGSDEPVEERVANAENPVADQRITDEDRAAYDAERTTEQEDLS